MNIEQEFHMHVIFIIGDSKQNKTKITRKSITTQLHFPLIQQNNH